LYQPHRAINLLEFREDIEINALGKFSTVFGMIDEGSLALCGYKLLGGRLRANIQAVVVCLRAGEKLGREEARCLTYLLTDLTEKGTASDNVGFQPLITLTHTE